MSPQKQKLVARILAAIMCGFMVFSILAQALMVFTL